MEIELQEAEQRKTFFDLLQNNVAIDLRDNRGKYHNMGVVLMGLLVGLCRKRDGNLSSIHRSMVNTHFALTEALGVENQRVISASHLPIILKKVNVIEFGNLVLAHFGIALTEQEKSWFSMDGKEMRGTILTGDTRGEAIVQAVHQESKMVYNQGYYNGSKESERGVVRELLRETGLASQGVSLDALHFVPSTLSCIAESGGYYMVGLKENQSEIYKDIEQLFKLKKADYQLFNKEKGHGRIETREYRLLNVSKEYFDKRWRFAQLKAAIEVKRTRLDMKTGKLSEEISLYMSNYIPSDMKQATLTYSRIRGHWAIEVNNHIRDVTLKEDALQTIFKAVAQPISIIRTLIINILKKLKVKNIAESLDNFADDFLLLIQFFKTVKIL